MTDQQIFNQFIQLADFISRCFSNDVEVVVHDTAHLDHSAVAVFNNHVSGRGVGAPMTDKGIDFLSKHIYETENFVVNYKGLTAKGTVVRSSTFFILNGQNKLIGALCVNVDIGKYTMIKQLMESFISMSDGESEEEQKAELLQLSLSDIINQAIVDICMKTGRDLDTFTMRDKLNIVLSLIEKGIFDRRGGISEVAKHLKVSEQTIYRYIKILKNESMNK